VDWITQAALGACIGELMLGKYLGKRALAWGALFGILPNLDVVLSLLLNTSHELAFRSGPTHSLLFITLATIGLTHGLKNRWKSQQISKPLIFSFAFTTMASHLLVECLTVEGASILWPFHHGRVAFNLIDHADYLFYLPLPVTALWLACTRRQIPKKNRSKKSTHTPTPHRPHLWGLGLTCGYTLLALAMKFTASSGFDADLKRRGTIYQRQTEAPTRHNIFLWRAVVDRGDEFWVGYRTVFESHNSPIRWTVYPRGQAALTGLEKTNEIETITRITNGWWLARPYAQGAWLADLRHAESRIWGAKKGMVDSRIAHSWLFNPTLESMRLRKIDESTRGDTKTLNRTAARIIGRHEAWEANPRLAGIPGSLPEFLAVEP